jgi:hypothetical protein
MTMATGRQLYRLNYLEQSLLAVVSVVSDFISMW